MTTEIATRKVVINACYGGFGLSHEAVIEYGRRKGTPIYGFVNPRITNGIDFERHVPASAEENPLFIHYCTTPEYSDDAYFSERNIARDDTILVALIEEWGSKRVSGKYAELEVVEIPADVEWQIEEYDGNEHIAEKHRTWP